MANKIVQLQNKDGDNIFPVSAGLASDSVTTDMIQNGAVTSEKVDFTTLVQKIPDSDFVLPSGETLLTNDSFCLFGNYVFININLAGCSTSGNSAFTAATISQKYRPQSGDQNLSVMPQSSNNTRLECWINSYGQFRTIVFPQQSNLAIRICGFYTIE